LAALILSWIPAFILWQTAREAWTVPLLDPDLWWQLWSGEQMLAGTFPRHNAISWTAPDAAWVTHEPLVALTYAAAGLGAVGWVRGVVVTAGYALVLHLATRRGSAWATIFAAAWAAPLIVFGTTERALSWGNLCLALTQVLVLRGTPRSLTAAAVVVGLWAHVHGSFVLGVLWLLLTNWRFGLAAAVLTLANPNGWHVWGLVSGYGVGAGTQGLVHDMVREWRPLDLTTASGITRLIWLVIPGVMVLRPQWPWKSGLERWRPRVLWLATIWLAVWHVRYTDIAGIVMLPFVARELELRLPRLRAMSPVPAFVVLMGITAAVSPRATTPQEHYPSALVHSIPSGARIWNDFHLGGFLGYHGRSVFWDSRNDCYPEDVFRDGLTVARMSPGWRDVLQRRRVDTVVTAQPELREALLKSGFHLQAGAGSVSVLSRAVGDQRNDAETP
jgi:hypothetical protein